jgi:transposase InsO family protein
VADVTSVATASGWLYLAVVLDLFSRRVVGWAMAATFDSELVEQALSMALTRAASLERVYCIILIGDVSIPAKRIRVF